MTRYRYPADRSAFVFGADLAPILTPPRTALVIYADQAQTTPADIQDLGGSAIANSTVYVNQGVLDEFLGPDGATRLWAARSGTSPYPLDAQALDVFEKSGGAGGAGTYVHTQAVPQTVWTVAHGLGRYPAAVSVFSADLGIQWDEFVVTHVDHFNLSITTDAPVAGVAFIGG